MSTGSEGCTGAVFKAAGKWGRRRRERLDSGNGAPGRQSDGPRASASPPVGRRGPHTRFLAPLM